MYQHEWNSLAFFAVVNFRHDQELLYVLRNAFQQVHHRKLNATGIEAAFFVEIHLFQLEHYERARLRVWVQRRNARVQVRALVLCLAAGIALTAGVRLLIG